MPRRPSRYEVGCNRVAFLWSENMASAMKLGIRARRKVSAHDNGFI